MESKIILYDANDKKIGETFVRRAKQLVKQQRAEWTDNSQTAIKFAPDVEDWETIVMPGEEKKSISTVDPGDAQLFALAEKRIRERKLFIIHSIAVFPVWLTLASISSNITRGSEAPMFFTGVCITAYAIHLYTRLMKYRSHDREERRVRRLATEVAILKAELQRQSV